MNANNIGQKIRNAKRDNHYDLCKAYLPHNNIENINTSYNVSDYHTKQEHNNMIIFIL